jgi:hypothetical protein
MKGTTMRKTVLPVLILLALTVPLIGQQQSNAPKGNVSILIDSRPDYAEIRIDGRFIGTTPLNYRLTPGVHKLELTRGHFNSWVRELTVTEGLPTRVTALLDSPAAEKPCATETPATQ